MLQTTNSKKSHSNKHEKGALRPNRYIRKLQTSHFFHLSLRNPSQLFSRGIRSYAKMAKANRLWHFSWPRKKNAPSCKCLVPSFFYRPKSKECCLETPESHSGSLDRNRLYSQLHKNTFYNSYFENAIRFNYLISLT